jgi:hypothetical protein
VGEVDREDRVSLCVEELSPGRRARSPADQAVDCAARPCSMVASSGLRSRRRLHRGQE